LRAAGGVGNYWVQTVPDEYALVVLDITESLKPARSAGWRLAMISSRTGFPPSRAETGS